VSYFTFGSVTTINSSVGSESGAGPYYPSILQDDNGNAVSISIGGTSYYFMYRGTDHGSTGDNTTGIYLYVCEVGDDVTVEANWVSISTIAAASTTNPIFDNTTAGANNQPETPCARWVDGEVLLTVHEALPDNTQRTIIYSSANGYSSWTDHGYILPDADSGEMSINHDGYFRWSRNHVFTGLPYKYIGWSLASWLNTVGGEDGDFYNSAIYGSNAPKTSWTRLRFEGMGQQPAFEGLTNTHRPLRIESACCPLGIRRTSTGEIVGITSVVQAASAADARTSVLAEIMYDRNARMISLPRAILTKATADANEQGQAEVVSFAGSQYMIYQAANASNVNTTAIAAITYTSTDTAPDPWPIKNAIKETDFRLLSELPSTMAKFSTSSVSFDSTTGITLSSASAANALLKLGDAFTPSNYDAITIMAYGLTCPLTGDVCNFGFMTGTESQDQLSDATENCQVYTTTNGGAKLGEKTAAGQTLYSTPTTTTGHGFGNQVNAGGSMRKQIGITWFPQRGTSGELLLLGEDAMPLFRQVCARTPTLATARIPAIAFNSTSGVKSITIQKLVIAYQAVGGLYQEITYNNIPIIGSKLIKVA